MAPEGHLRAPNRGFPDVLKILSFGNKRAQAEPYNEWEGEAQGYAQQHTLNGAPEQLGAEGWLTVHHVRKSYKKRLVVRGVSLAVGRGESVGLLGPNGAGKTTVFYMITGLVPADAGNITIDGMDVTRLPMYRRARLGIGYLPQEASIFRGLTVEKNIMAVLEIVEPSAKKRREKLDSLLEEFRITHLRKSPSHRAFRRRTSPLRDRPCTRLRPVIHAAGRTLRRHRPYRRRRYSGVGAALDGAGHRRAHHRS